MVEQFVFDSLVYFAAIVGILTLTGRGKRRYRAEAEALRTEVETLQATLEYLATELSELSAEVSAPVENSRVEFVSTEVITPVASMTVPQLKAECKRRGIKGYSKLRKNDLIELLTQTREVANV